MQIMSLKPESSKLLCCILIKARAHTLHFLKYKEKVEMIFGRSSTSSFTHSISTLVAVLYFIAVLGGAVCYSYNEISTKGCVLILKSNWDLLMIKC